MGQSHSPRAHISRCASAMDFTSLAIACGLEKRRFGGGIDVRSMISSRFRVLRNIIACIDYICQVLQEIIDFRAIATTNILRINATM